MVKVPVYYHEVYQAYELFLPFLVVEFLVDLVRAYQVLLPLHLDPLKCYYRHRLFYHRILTCQTYFAMRQFHPASNVVLLVHNQLIYLL